MLASSNLNKGAGQNASRLSTNLVNIFKVWHFDNPVNGLFMGLEKREADEGVLVSGRIRLEGEGRRPTFRAPRLAEEGDESLLLEVYAQGWL